MTTIINPSTSSEVTTPISYVSRWIAQSHGSYQKKSDHFYSTSSSSTCDCSSSTNIPFIRSSIITHKTTWQAQPRSRTNTNSSSLMASSNLHDNELQEKLQQVRALLNSKKQRSCRQNLSASISSSSSSSSSPNNPLLLTKTLGDQVSNLPTVVGDQSSSSSPPPPPSSTSAPIPLVSPTTLENVYHQPQDESFSSSTNLMHSYHSCLHHQHSHHHPSLPCLMEESPSDSGLSDGTKTTHHDDLNDSIIKNPAIIDLSKPLSKEEMLAIMQIIRELWKKQFDCDIPTLPLKISSTPSVTPKSSLSIKNKTQYHSTPSLNKLSAELNDIKDKLKRFASERQPSTTTTISNQPKSSESENSHGDVDEDAVFVSFGNPLTADDLERMKTKKDSLIRRQMERHNDQLVKKTERQIIAAERQDEYRLFEEYLAQRRDEDEQRRKTILRAHIDQKRLEADPPSSHDHYFTAARLRNRLKRKSSLTSFLSFDEDFSRTPQRSVTQFDMMSPSLTAPTTASRSKMNRAASSCHINGQYDSSTSLNSKATVSFGSLNLSKSQQHLNTPKKRSVNIIDDAFDFLEESPLSVSMNSLSTSIAGARLNRSQTLLNTKSNKQTIINCLKQVVLAGPANDRQRDVIIREIELTEARHFVLLFRDHRLQFRAIYMYIPDTDIIEKLHGIGPNIITEVMVEKWFKYNSGGKRFSNIPIKHFSIQCDAIIIHNDFWQKKLLIHMNKLH